MPWKEETTMSLRYEFVTLATGEDANIRKLCRQYGISPKTGYKWIHRYRQNGFDGLEGLSRRPRRSPGKTICAVEREVLNIRKKHPAWGGRKIHARLLTLGYTKVPAASTITDILRRHGKLDPTESVKHKPLVRFVHEHPNDLWQMDFLGHFPLVHGRCHTLTVLDDSSRFNIAIRACGNEKGIIVQKHLIDIFRRYGLPVRILTDNGSPWGCDSEHRYTWLSAWLVRLGIGISHGRPHHPQTQGKDERFNRTVKEEAIRGRGFRDLTDAQKRFDHWRDIYNLERPHESLEMATPASRYQTSGRPYPEMLSPIEYQPGDVVRRVNKDGYFQYCNKKYKISQAFQGYPIALRTTPTDGIMDVFFCHQKVVQINTRGYNGLD